MGQGKKAVCNAPNATEASSIPRSKAFHPSRRGPVRPNNVTRPGRDRDA
eukprot:CAMPEP_0119354574 /NCGR_PEP_ID=MMETSP1334-20130426/3559_1 /TAXON_ID=127549 /ORGANISM="Calcidiscus leptoporus, Strain RCC1130" /LENGTH=48 /DNA_ID= /DNA_START= /DNA_END= /DNA_ORIENTATION=